MTTVNGLVVLTARPGSPSNLLDSPRTITDFSTASTVPHPMPVSAAVSEVKAVTFDISAVGRWEPQFEEEIERDEHAQLKEALQSSKDRLWVLKVGESMETLISQRSTQKLEICPATSYQRMLLHRAADFYKLLPVHDSQTKVISVSLTPESRIPRVRLSELVPNEETPQIKFQIMRRSAPDRRRPRNGSADDSDGGSEGGSSTGHSKRMTIAEREAAYKEARSRIFMDFEGNKVEPSASSSTQALLEPSTVNAQSSKQPFPAVPELSHSKSSKELRKDVSVQSPTPPEMEPPPEQILEEDPTDVPRDVMYPTLYNPAPALMEGTPQAYPLFTPYYQPVVMPAYPYFSPPQYAFQPTYAPIGHSGAPPSLYYPPNPYLPQQPPFMWVMQPSGPTPQMMPGEQQPPDAGAYMPAYYPQMATMQPVPSQYPYQPSNPSQSMQYQQPLPPADGTHSLPRGPPTLMPPAPYANGRNGTGWHQSGKGQGGPRTNSFNSATGRPFEKGRMGPRSVSGTSNGSGSGSGSRTPLDDTSSTVSSSTSSSSRNTYTSTSSRHPLPPRPDWAVGLSPTAERRALSSQPPPRYQDFPPLAGSKAAQPQKLGGAWSSGSKPVISAAHSETNGSPTASKAVAIEPVSNGAHQPQPQLSTPAGSRLDERDYERPPPKSAELFDHRGKKASAVPRQATPTQNGHRGLAAMTHGVDGLMTEAMAKMRVTERVMDGPSAALLEADATPRGSLAV